MQHRRLVVGVAAVLATLTTSFVGPSALAAPTAPTAAPARANAEFFPTTIALPNGWLPEGIAIGVLPFAFFGSRADGDLYRANLITGQGEVFSQGPGTPSVGLKVDLLGRLFVSGGPGGDGRVVSAFTGNVLASYKFTTDPSFVNDVVLTPNAAYFTDSMQPFLYKLPLGRFGGLPAADGFVKIPLTGDYVHQPGFNLNGIARTPDGTGLLVVQSATGFLFRVNPATGVTTRVDLGANLLTNGDGLLTDGRTLYVVQNRNNQVTVYRLNSAGTSGTLQATLTDARFDVPTTVAKFANRLYLPNARFTTPPTPDTPYSANAITAAS
jgi:sugar lactone lactonase YvrE